MLDYGVAVLFCLVVSIRIIALYKLTMHGCSAVFVFLLLVTTASSLVIMVSDVLDFIPPYNIYVKRSLDGLFLIESHWVLFIILKQTIPMLSESVTPDGDSNKQYILSICFCVLFWNLLPWIVLANSDLKMEQREIYLRLTACSVFSAISLIFMGCVIQKSWSNVLSSIHGQMMAIMVFILTMATEIVRTTQYDQIWLLLLECLFLEIACLTSLLCSFHGKLYRAIQQLELPESNLNM